MADSVDFLKSLTRESGFWNDPKTVVEQAPKCFIDPENPGSIKHEFRQAGTGVPARAPE